MRVPTQVLVDNAGAPLPSYFVQSGAEVLWEAVVVKSTSKKQAFLSCCMPAFSCTQTSANRNVPVEAPVNPAAQIFCARLYVVHGRDRIASRDFSKGPRASLSLCAPSMNTCSVNSLIDGPSGCPSFHGCSCSQINHWGSLVYRCGYRMALRQRSCRLVLCVATSLTPV